MRKPQSEVESFQTMKAQRTVVVTLNELNDISWGLYLARLNTQARLADALRTHSPEDWAVLDAQEDLNHIRCSEAVLENIRSRAYVALTGEEVALDDAI